MSRILKLLLLVPAWLFCAWGSLLLHTMDLNLGHSICGPWGCGPPVEALLGFHAFSLTMLVPLVVGAGFYFSPTTSRKMGMGIAVLGVLLVGATAGRATYNHWVSSGSAEYLIQKFFFSIATNVDVPMLQIVAAGCGLMWLGRRQVATTDEVEPAAKESLNAPAV